MDPKTEAQHRRELADALDVVAEKFQPLNAAAAGSYRLNAEANRNLADELDPPQPEWRDGDYVRDKNGGVWRHDGSVWRSAGGGCALASDLPHLYGPLTRVLTYDPATQRVADPAKQEVVVSLDGINRDALDQWAKWAACEPAEEVCIRAAKAAREQLGEVQ